VAPADKSTQQQLREIRKLVADAEEVLAQIARGLKLLEDRLAQPEGRDAPADPPR
jgi:hypothetical protein